MSEGRRGEARSVCGGGDEPDGAGVVMVVEGVGEVLRLHGHPRIRPEDGTTRRMRVGPAGLMPLGGVAAGRATSRRRHGRGEIAHASSGSLGGVG